SSSSLQLFLRNSRCFSSGTSSACSNNRSTSFQRSGVTISIPKPATSLPVEFDCAGNLFETRVSAQRIEYRVHVELECEPIRFFSHFRQPAESLFDISAAQVCKNVIGGRDVLAQRTLAIQVLQLP